MALPQKSGVLLINLGTPDAPHPAEVRRFLREFLRDPKVIDIHLVARFFLLEGVILPTRPKRTAAAYRKVWLPEGSPLLVHSRALAAALSGALGPEVPVALGMQYGRPSIAQGLAELQAQGVDRVLAAPLFPQFATSSTGSSMERVYRAATDMWAMPTLSALPPFFGAKAFLDAFCEVARPALDAFGPAHLLFSFHGLPERHIRKCDTSGAHCLQTPTCCDALGEVNRYCYRAQCHATARGLAERLALPPSGWTLSFQSRLGRTPWIKPFTDQVLPELAKRGVRRVAVMCPAFVADCLETLEEIGIRARDEFRAAGGEDLMLVPSLNAHPAWVSGLASMIGAQLQGFERASID